MIKNYLVVDHKKIIFFVIFFCFGLYQASALSEKGEPIIMQNADSLLGSRTEMSDIRHFYGNVRFKQGNVNVVCDSAIQYLARNFVKLRGNVIITQKDLTMEAPYVDYDGNTYTAKAKKGVVINERGTFIGADRGRYNSKTKEVNFYGNVVVEDDSVIIFADRIKHFRDNEKTYAYGNVKIKGIYNNTVLRSDSLFHNPSINFTLSYGKPVVRQIDSTEVPASELRSLKDTTLTMINGKFFRYDTLRIKSDTMKTYRISKNETYVFIDSVSILEKDIAAKSNYALYKKTSGMIRMETDPVIWYEDSQLFGDTIRIRLNNNSLEELHAIQNAFMLTQSKKNHPERADQMSSDTISMLFKNDKINSIVAKGNVKSLYFLFTDDIPNGADIAGTDKVELKFKEDELRFIVRTGMVKGETIPEHVIIRDIRSHYLPSYKMRNDIPEKQDFIKK